MKKSLFLGAMALLLPEFLLAQGGGWGNITCHDLVDRSNGQQSRLVGNDYIVIPYPQPRDSYEAELWAYRTNLCRRRLQGEISAEQARELERQKIDSLRDRWTDQKRYEQQERYKEEV